MAAKKLDVTVMLVDAEQKQRAETLKKLKAAGFELGESLEAIGVVTGKAPKAAIQKLAKVRGVSAVEEGRSDYHTQQ